MESQEVIVSILMLAYNHEKYIGQALESVLAQKTNFKFEILVGEDCSTDATRKIVEEFKERCPDIIRLFAHEKNVGATKNSCHIVKSARGKYCAVCEGDDFWCDENRLQRDVDFLERNPDYVGISNRCKIVDEEGNDISSEDLGVRAKFWEFDKTVFTLKDFEAWKLPGHSSALTRRNIFLDKNLDFSIIYKASEAVGDRANTLLHLMYGNIYCSDKVVSCYRYRITSLGTNYMSQYKYKNLKDKDYLMIRRLEAWALEDRGILLNLEHVKKDRLAGSVVIFMKEPSGYNFNVVRRIVGYSGTPLLYIRYIFKIWILKMYYWYVKKEDALIRL